MQNTSRQSESPSKQHLLDELRVRYETKYGNDQGIKEVIREQLEKIKAKPRLSMSDLNEIDTVVSQVSKSAVSKSTAAYSHENSSPKMKRNLFNSSLSPLRLPAIDPPTSRYKKLSDFELHSSQLSIKASDNNDKNKPRRLSKSNSAATFQSLLQTNPKQLSVSTTSHQIPNQNMLTSLNGSVINFEKTNQYVIDLCSSF